MADPETSPLDAKLGYSSVDVQADAALMIAGMDATATWPAVQRLRAWEHARLAPQPGERVLDVGCGLGDVAITLAQEVSPDGHVVGVDFSTVMLDVARQRAAGRVGDVTFHTADAMDLDEPDASFDICRSERVLQWLPDPSRAVTEMARVLRPGGRLCVADTDWKTLTVDLPGHDAAITAFHDAFWSMRGAPASVGSKLLNLCRDAGLVNLEVNAATHLWTRWDPDTSWAPDTIFPIPLVVRQMVETGALDESAGAQLVDQLVHAARSDRFFVSVGMFAVFGTRSAVAST